MADRYEGRYRDDEYRRGERARSYGRDYGRDDRGFFDRASDELRSWFGDEEADRRRRADEARYGRDADRYGRESEKYGGNDRYGSPERYGSDRYGEGRYGRDWDYGNRPGYDYDRGSREFRDRDWSRAASGSESAGADSWRPGWPAYSNEPYRAGASTGAFGSKRSGPYAGRGPRGYQRSDDRIREDVCDRLSEDPWIDAGDIEVVVRAGEVTLSGGVRDRNDKRRAEDVAENIAGVREVHNNLRVSGWDASEGRSEGRQPEVSQTPGNVTSSSTNTRR